MCRDMCVGQVRNVKVGDRVMGVTRFGGYTQEAVVDSRQLFAVPECWSLSDAAAFLCTALTAWYGLLKIGHLQTGQLVAIQSAAGGVGLAATEIVLGMGAVPICIVGSEAKVHVLLER
jgi:NADPH:quinone reductase-like Zn-dependent oxidoreductase